MSETARRSLGTGPNSSRRDEFDGSESERVAQSHFPIGNQKWAERVGGLDGRAVNASVESVQIDILAELRAIRIGIEMLCREFTRDEIDLVEEATNQAP